MNKFNMPQDLNLPQDKVLAGQIIEAHTVETAKKLDIGLMGRLFGTSTEKPGNIAGFAVIVSFLLLSVILVWGEDTPSLSKKDALLMVAGFISLTLGFVFGRSTS